MIARIATVCGILVCASAAGCGDSRGNGEPDVLKRPRLEVASSVLERYSGTYELTSGAHFTVVHEDGRLLGGTPPAELVPKTTREFHSNRLPGSFHFERIAAENSVQLRRQIGDSEFVCRRIDRNDSADPAVMVDAGGHRIRMLITGSGSPPIVLEDGFGSGIDIQAELQADLAALSTVVTWDHAGTGGSDIGPAPRDGRRVMHELRIALKNAGVQPPYLLIGSSIGGDSIRIFASEFPDAAAALILLDPTPDWNALQQWAQQHAPQRAATYGRLVTRMDGVMDDMMEVQEPGRFAEWDSVDVTRSQAKDALPLPDLPVVQITGAAGRRFHAEVDDKVRFFEHWLTEHIPQARHVLAPHSGHAVVLGDRRLVPDEVKALLEQLRSE